MNVQRRPRCTFIPLPAPTQGHKTLKLCHRRAATPRMNVQHHLTDGHRRPARDPTLRTRCQDAASGPRPAAVLTALPDPPARCDPPLPTPARAVPAR